MTIKLSPLQKKTAVQDAGSIAAIMQQVLKGRTNWAGRRSIFGWWG